LPLRLLPRHYHRKAEIDLVLGTPDDLDSLGERVLSEAERRELGQNMGETIDRRSHKPMVRTNSDGHRGRIRDVEEIHQQPHSTRLIFLDSHQCPYPYPPPFPTFPLRSPPTSPLYLRCSSSLWQAEDISGEVGSSLHRHTDHHSPLPVPAYPGASRLTRQRRY